MEVGKREQPLHKTSLAFRIEEKANGPLLASHQVDEGTIRGFSRAATERGQLSEDSGLGKLAATRRISKWLRESTPIYAGNDTVTSEPIGKSGGVGTQALR